MRLLKSNTNSTTNNGIRAMNVRPTETVGGAVAPAPPKFTILKRPPAPSPLVKAAANASPNPFDDDPATATTPEPSTIHSGLPEVFHQPRDAGVAKRPPVKTLEQRKQEYAEARLRILGDAKFSDDDDDDDNNNAKTQPAANQKQQPEARKSSGNAGPPRAPPVHNFNNTMQPVEHPVRTPRGPDGSTGFQARR